MAAFTSKPSETCGSVAFHLKLAGVLLLPPSPLKLAGVSHYNQRVQSIMRHAALFSSRAVFGRVNATLRHHTDSARRRQNDDHCRVGFANRFVLGVGAGGGRSGLLMYNWRHAFFCCSCDSMARLQFTSWVLCLQCPLGDILPPFISSPRPDRFAWCRHVSDFFAMRFRSVRLMCTHLRCFSSLLTQLCTHHKVSTHF